MSSELHAMITGDKLRVWWQFAPPAAGSEDSDLQCFEDYAPLTGLGDDLTRIEAGNFWPTKFYVSSLSISYANGYEVTFGTREL